ncbi:MAG TPA: hypothetical protein VJT73_08750 [Polyangiaceae bacterium]|nr:hypothetical protein [Polyangiaceae bacterium]
MVTCPVMRFGVLGPANGDLAALEQGASLLLLRHHAEEVIYLGPDDALDRVVGGWARRLVGGDPTDHGIWGRAAARCVAGNPQEIDRFMAAERQRERLKSLKCLPAATARTVEILEGRVAVLLYDKALLDEEDILPASLLIFGKNKEPLVRQVGSRTFVSPGEFGGRGGIALFADDAHGEVTVSMYERGGDVLESHAVAATRTGRFTVLDKAPG